MRRFLTGKTTWRVHDDARSALLIDVQDYYRAFYVAASLARRSILILGWQFDSDVQLLRGDDHASKAQAWRSATRGADVTAEGGRRRS